MSTADPNPADSNPAAASNVAASNAAPSAPAPAVPVPAAPRHSLSVFLKVSIVLLAALAVATIALVFVGPFEGKVERITATFLIFAVFVGLTAADTSRGQRNSWYAPVALIANSYILALLLIVTWMSDSGWFLGASIFWKSLLVIAVTRAVVACCQVLLGLGEGKSETLSRFAFVTSVLAVVSGILFTAPLAIEVFDITIPELYWKIAVAALLLTGLGLAITLLVRWAYGSDERETKRRERIAAGEAYAAQQQANAQLQTAQAQAQAQAAAAQARELSASVTQNAPVSVPPQAPAAPAQPLLPWPTFADGRPLPARADGQPDFSVPGAPAPPRL